MLSSTEKSGWMAVSTFIHPIITSLFFLHCRVLVLNSGRIVEFDTPHNLLRQKGVFSEMVTEAGITYDTDA